MNLQSLLNQNKENYRNILDFFDENTDERYSQNINTFLNDLMIRNDTHEIRLFMKTLLKISNNHHRYPNFFNKVEQILVLLKNNIQEFSNSEIFKIFHSNKRILLFLIKEEMLTIDEHIFNEIMTTKKYIDAKFPHYFLPEIKKYLNKSWISEFTYVNKFCGYGLKLIEELKIEIPETFEENRINGENESYICQLIRNDSIIEFIKYVNRNNYSLKSKIKPSIYETNLFLIKKQIQIYKKIGELIEVSENWPTLIEYAAFYGSIQIFQYLRLNGVDLEPNLDIYAIHSNNPEFIHILEANRVKFDEYCLYESIKCHHNEIANYIKENYLNEGCENSCDFIYSVFENYNFAFIENNCFNQDCFYLLSKFDYYQFVKFLMNDEGYDINRKYILKCKN